MFFFHSFPLQKQLKKRCPPENLFRKSDRILPKFQVTNVKQKFKKNGPSKSVLCLKFLESYCSSLLQCEEKISRSNELIQFFLPQSQDLQPDFQKNSIVVMPSEDQEESLGSAVNGKRFSEGNVSQPFITETYRCVAPFETKDTKNRPFKVAVNEVVDVLIKDPAGWWLVENEDKQLAWFPAPYLEKNEEDVDDNLPDVSEEGMLYCTLRNYEAKIADELSVNIGAVVEVLQTSDDGWWLIRYHGKAGYVPSMYLKPYRNPHLRFQNLQQEMRSSNLNLSHLQSTEANLLSLQKRDLSRSQEILQSRRSSPPAGGFLLLPSDKKKSRSLNQLSARRQAFAIPTITVEGDEREEEQPRKDSLSEESELSFSDESSSQDSDFLSVSQPDMADRLRMSRTPPPMVADRQSPNCISATLPRETLSSARSDPNLFKTPTIPKVPPRPKAQEILTRCTTMTRKAALASKTRLSIELEEIQSR
ncbi:NOXO1 oxidase, partial [Amia calva]|nr:NOXO1 oxidase [Amia calva]